MKSNFDFLIKNADTQPLQSTTVDAEELYTIGKFSNEFESIRKVIEKVARDILDLNYVNVGKFSTFNDCLHEIKKRQLIDKKTLSEFYFLKSQGNKAAHSLHQYSKDEALDGLEKMFDILVSFTECYYDETKTSDFFEPRPERKLYQTTAERKLIYVQTADNSNGMWPAYNGLEKVGDATIESFEMDNRPNSKDLRSVATRRIDQYMKTANVPYTLQWAELAYRDLDKSWFRDYDVHNVLLRSGVRKEELGEGQEWFKTNVDTVKDAIVAVKNGQQSIDDNVNIEYKIKLRPEQKAAISKTKKAFKNNWKMLWNAKMRFGKTLSALRLIKDEQYRHVLIMTHRPIVDSGWFEDF